MKDGSSRIDIFNGGFTLICYGTQGPVDKTLADAANKVNLPLERVAITETKAMDLYQRRLILVRPDGMIAWHGELLPHDVGELVDRARGTPANGSPRPNNVIVA